jgi:hypothetical protein
MLIHVTRYIQVQKDVHRQVKEYVTGLRQRITRGVDDTESLEQMRKLWEEDFSPTRTAVIERLVESETQPPDHSWDEIRQKLGDVLSDIEVRMINGKAKDVLDYATPGTKGLKVIAVGGDKLARGLTLEGLCPVTLSAHQKCTTPSCKWGDGSGTALAIWISAACTRRMI